MTAVTSTWAKAHFSDLLDRVEAGEVIGIKRNGKIVAQITWQTEVAAPKNLPADPEQTGGVLRAAPEAAKAFASRDERRAAVEINVAERDPLARDRDSSMDRALPDAGVAAGGGEVAGSSPVRPHQTTQEAGSVTLTIPRGYEPPKEPPGGGASGVGAIILVKSPEKKPARGLTLAEIMKASG